MSKEHIAAGTEVPAGIYRCNACANKYTVERPGGKLPSCEVCDSISWRTLKLSKNANGEKHGKA